MHGQASPAQGTPKASARTKVERSIYRRRTRAGAIRYEVAYFDGDGAQRWRTVASLKAARALRAELAVKVARGEVVTPTKLTFAEAAESWFEARAPRLRPRTAQYYRSALDLVLLPRFGKTRLATIDADAIAKLIRDLEREGLRAVDQQRVVRPLGRSSIQNYIKPLQGVLAHAVRRRQIPMNPFDTLTADDRPKAGERRAAHEWTDDDVSALLDASRTLAAKPTSRYDYTPLIRLVATLGLRKSEALGLRWEDFNKDEGFIHVRRQWTPAGTYGPTKTAAGVRRIALPDDLKDELIAQRLQSRYSLDEHPIFASIEGTPLGHRNVSRRGFDPARDAAGLPSTLTFHDLRGAAASRLISGGLDPVTVADVLGHEDATTTLKVYAHLFDRSRTDEAVRMALRR